MINRNAITITMAYNSNSLEHELHENSLMDKKKKEFTATLTSVSIINK